MAHAPCKDCTNRSYKCHSTCEKYISFQKDNEREKKALGVMRARYAKTAKSALCMNHFCKLGENHKK